MALKKVYAAATFLAVASAAMAQEWPEGHIRPQNFPWETLWPVNNNDDVKQLLLGEEYAQADKAYMNFANERHAMGMVRSFFRVDRYRPEFDARGLAKRVSEMKIGDTETWKGEGYSGKFQLVGTEYVGPHTCRQVEWTMSNPTKVIVGNAAGKAVRHTLYCLDPKANEWIEINRVMR